jgi:hypothetical protein
MRDYTKRFGLAMAFLASLLPGVAAAAPVITVGVNLPAPVVLVRPPLPAVGWMWVDGAYVVDPVGIRVWRPGYWAPPVVHRPVVQRAVVVHRPVVQRTVVTRPAPRAVVVRR